MRNGEKGGLFRNGKLDGEKVLTMGGGQ